jgi:hypothetical protein
MVKLPALEGKEVQRLVEAIEYYCAHVTDAGREPEDVQPYEHLAVMLRQRAKLSPANELQSHLT